MGLLQVIMAVIKVLAHARKGFTKLAGSMVALFIVIKNLRMKKHNQRKRNVRFELPAEMVDAINSIDFKTYSFRNRQPKYKKETVPVEFRNDCMKFVHQLLKHADHRFDGDYKRWNKSKPSAYYEKTYGKYYFNVIVCLLEAGIIQCDDSYIAGKENLGYRLSPHFFDKVESIKTISYTWTYPDKHVIIDPNHFYYINTPLLSTLYNYNSLFQSFILHICTAKFVSSGKVADYTHLSNKYKYLSIDVEAIYSAARKDGLIYVPLNSKPGLIYVPQYSLDFAASCEEVLNSEGFAYRDGDDIIDGCVYGINDWIVGKEYSIKSENLKAKLLQVDYCQASLILYKETFYIDNVVSFVERKVSSLHIHYTSVIRNLLDRNYKLNQNDKNNRLNSVFTNMKSAIMEVIKESNSLVELDLRNSQFAVLAYWLKAEGLINKHSDVKRFYELSITGLLYETMMNETGMKREAMKDEMFGIMFSSENNNTTGKKKIRELFPNVIAFIDNYKSNAKKGYKEFPVELQKREADIFINNLLYRINALSLFAITKHDSLIFKEQDTEIILGIVKTYLNHINFEGTVRLNKTCIFIGSERNADAYSGVLGTPIQDETIPTIDITMEETGADNEEKNAIYASIFYRIEKEYRWTLEIKDRKMDHNSIIALEHMSGKYAPAKELLELIRA